MERINQSDFQEGVRYWERITVLEGCLEAERARFAFWQSRMSIEYNLGLQDTLDIQTGLIARKDSDNGRQEVNGERIGEGDSRSGERDEHLRASPGTERARSG